MTYLLRRIKRKLPKREPKPLTAQRSVKIMVRSLSLASLLIGVTITTLIWLILKKINPNKMDLQSDLMARCAANPSMLIHSKTSTRFVKWPGSDDWTTTMNDRMKA